MTQPIAWHINASNLAEHARNPIHTDAGAQAAGFPRALVAGVTTYAYLTHPLIVAWGEKWLHNGGGEVRFRRPVFDGDVFQATPTSPGRTRIQFPGVVEVLSHRQVPGFRRVDFQ